MLTGIGEGPDDICLPGRDRPLPAVLRQPPRREVFQQTAMEYEMEWNAQKVR
jgi:hypothetical protein